MFGGDVNMCEHVLTWGWVLRLWLKWRFVFFFFPLGVVPYSETMETYSKGMLYEMGCVNCNTFLWTVPYGPGILFSLPLDAQDFFFS